MSRLSLAMTLFQTWWEDNDSWDGAALYLDEDTAKTHAARDYLGYEYCCNGECDDEGTDEHAALPELDWIAEHGSWHLLADNTDTGVRVSSTPVYRSSTPHEVAQQDALRDAEKAEYAARVQQSVGQNRKSVAAQLEDLFMKRSTP